MREGGRGYAGLGTAIAAFVAIGLAAMGVIHGTWAVGGSDSSCYGLMARAFAEGHLQPVSALADAPWRISAGCSVRQRSLACGQRG